MTRPKIVAISGGSAGVGRAAVRRFARRGYDVAVLARGRAGLEGARREIEEAGRRSLVVPVDVADGNAVTQAVERIERELGPIDVWVNVAMTTVFGQFKDMTLEEFKRVTEVDYLGFVHGTHAVLRPMLERDRGVIVQVGSTLAYRTIPLQSAYCGAKHAIRGFTNSLRTELLHARSRVHLTMVQLPALNTPQFDWCENKMGRRSQPVPPIYQPEVAAEAILYAAEHRRRELYVGGRTGLFIIGNKLMPSVGDRYLAKHGFSSQQYDGAASQRRSNLWSPVDDEEDHGAHGSFGHRSRRRSRELWISMHKAPLAAGLAVLVGIGYLVLRNAA